MTCTARPTIAEELTPLGANFESELLARLPPGAAQRLKLGTVGIAGCGGLGSNVAIMLARSGIGKLVLVDFDVIEPSNLNRQAYFVDQLGQPKVQALASNLRRINPFVELECHQLRLTRDCVVRLFAGCHVVTECFDVAAAKAELSGGMRRDLPQVPLIAVSGIAGTGPLSTIRSRRVFGRHFLIGDGTTEVTESVGLLASRVTAAAAHQANITLRILIGALGESDGE